MKNNLFFNKAEIQSGSSRIDHAEGLIKQLPKDHNGRNTWLMNYGKTAEASKLRLKNKIKWDSKTQSAETRS